MQREVRDQRVQGAFHKGPSRANFQLSDAGCPDRLIKPEPQDQCGDSGPHACGRRAGAAVMDDRTTQRKHGRVVHLGDNLDVVGLRNVGELIWAGANQRPLA